jgi:choline dehydrogenase-like flavoprotein
MGLKQRPDVVVVGSGAGGSAAAWRLVEQGLQVLVLEAGPRFDPVRDYRLTEPNWEQTGFPEKPGSQGRTTFTALQMLGEEHSDLRSWNKAIGQLNKSGQREVSGPGYHHVRGVGGTTLQFVGEAHRLHPASMRMHSDYGLGFDWPLSYADLEPYYGIAERLIGVAGPSIQEVRWRSSPYPLPPHRLCRASARLAEAGKKLGMAWQANARAALSETYDSRPACNYCGNCSRGCPLGDKGSADVTFIRHAEASGQIGRAHV